MSLPLSPSAIAAQGLGLTLAEGLPKAREPLDCQTCGTTIQAGEPYLDWRPSRGTFTDFQYLASPSGVICPACERMVSNPVMIKTQAAVISTTGAWSLSKDAHRVWWLLTPPAPPYVAVISDSMKQHLIWRAPVTLSNDLLRIRIGMANLSIDRPRLLQAVDACQAAAQIARAHQIKVTPDHPYRVLDRKRSDLEHGLIRTDIHALAVTLTRQGDPTLQQHLDVLSTLGEGELWALSCLVKAKKELPIDEPITLSLTKGDLE